MPANALVKTATSLRRMFIPTPMVRVGLFFLAEDAMHVVSVLGRMGVCQVDRLPADLEDFLEPCFPVEFRDAYRRLRQPYESLMQRWQLSGLEPATAQRPRVPTVDEMQRLTARLEELASRVQQVSRRRRQMDERQLQIEHFEEYVRVLAQLDIDVNALSDLRFLHVRSGTVPKENLERLRESAQLGGGLVLNLGGHGDRAQVMVVGVAGISPDLEGLLEKAHFEPYAVPSHEARNPSQSMQVQLKTESGKLARELQRLASEEAELQQANLPLLREAGAAVCCASVFADCEGVLQGRLPVSFLNGWVAADHVDALRQSLNADVPNPVVLVEQPPTAQLGESGPPSEILLPQILKPGLQLVSMYGAPGYDELNPTLVLSVATPLLFGMMFGDVGHGAILLIAMLVLHRWLGHWVAVGVSCSIGAIAFGFLYGSFFGFEHLLPAVWMQPMQDPFQLLAVALWVGVGFVLLTFLMKAVNLLRQDDWLAATIGFQGMAGAVLYIGGVASARSFYDGTDVMRLPIVMILAGVISIAIHTRHQVRHLGRGVLADLISEYFHALLSLLTNTLSFLRLAAFALAHSALSLATLLVMETIPPTVTGWICRVLVFLFGTAVILVLDGLAVGIQTVRLQFYEGLARYYRGDGRIFLPLRFSSELPANPVRAASTTSA